MPDDITPVSVTVAFWRWFWVGIGALVLLGGLTYAGHVFGWWLSAQDASHDTMNTQNGYANQSTLRAQVTNKLAEVTQITTRLAAAGTDASMVAALKPQRAAIAGEACADAAQVTDGLPAQQAQWAAGNCSGGSLSPSSPLYVTGAP